MIPLQKQGDENAVAQVLLFMKADNFISWKVMIIVQVGCERYADKVRWWLQVGHIIS